MTPEVLAAILDTLRSSLRLDIAESTITFPDGTEMWVLEAVDHSGERWIAKHSDYGGAVLLLANMVGFDLMDG